MHWQDKYKRPSLNASIANTMRHISSSSMLYDEAATSVITVLHLSKRPSNCGKTPSSEDSRMRSS